MAEAEVVCFAIVMCIQLFTMVKAPSTYVDDKYDKGPFPPVCSDISCYIKIQLSSTVL